MKLSSAQRLYALGAILLTALAVCAHNFSHKGAPSFLIPLALAGVGYLLAFRELSSASSLPKRVLFFGLALAAFWHLFFLRLPPGLDDDVHRYVWDGRVQRLGYNPYLLVPNDPAFASLHTAETITLNNPEVPSPYPPAAQLFFRAVASLHESVFAFKLAFVLCDVAIVLLLFDLLPRIGRPQHWVLAFAWHPLLPIEVAGSGHVDILGALLLLLSALALARHLRAAAAAAFSLAVAVKFLPIVLAPLYWKRLRLRDAALAVAVFVLLYLPFLHHGRIPFGSFGAYVQRFRFNDPVFSTLERWAAPQFVAALALFVGWLTAFAVSRKSAEPSSSAFAWPMAASLFCAPVVYPWYMLWALPFFRSVAVLPILVWSVSILPTYYVWHLRTLGRPWVVPAWILWLEYGSVALTSVFALIFHLRRPTRAQAPVGQRNVSPHA